ncbi:ankyrin repeat domain-containing protein 9 [Lampris incognitus]|uniref:ankyrin repeat domain-containing protein 9 n=1 Tax=Lampris incognitus TaxID=2546036 RepID=UPI0024B4CBD8|nr:ankyrin repeat domain-containing protein 9 [Lampris incognitus]
MASPGNSSAPQTSGKQMKSFSLLFYKAVRDHKPVWMLEDMRTMETFYQEDDAGRRIYSPSEALLYAIVHDHQAYAQYLLSHYSEEALARPGERFFCFPSSAPHLAMAVRYDRRYILGLILQEAHRTRAVAAAAACRSRGGGFPAEDGKTPLHLACELLRPEAVIMLLGNGAPPLAVDHNGMTPLDVVLDKFRGAGVNAAETRQCLDNLLMFMPEMNFKSKRALAKDPDCWTEALGEETYQYVVGRSPAPLLLLAMQTTLRQLSPASFPESLDELPIPSSLKPPGLPSARRLRTRLM